MEKKKTPGPVLVTPLGRLSWPYLFKPNSEGEYPSDKYEAQLLIPKTLDITPLIKAATEMLHREEAPKTRKLSETTHPPIKDGDKADFDAYAGHWIIKAKTGTKPLIAGPDRKPLENAEEQVFGGANARLSIQPFYYSKKGGGISWSLRAVQIFSGGERFGAKAVDPEEDFPDDQEAPKVLSDEF